MSNFNRLKDCAVTNKNVIVRVDINVPIVAGIIKDDSRIKAVIPTLQYLIKNRAKVIVISHFGRPEGKRIAEMSLQPLVSRIQDLLGIKVHFVDDCVGDKVNKTVAALDYGEIILLENLRFYQEETENDENFSRKLASLGNLYVNDAFSCSHRAHASITGIPAILKSCAGLLMESELDNLQALLGSNNKDLIAIVGGSKISTKIDLLNNLSQKAKAIFVGGGMANSFLYALGKNIGKSLCEKDLKNTALQILDLAKKNNCQIILPEDVVVCRELKNNTTSQVISVDEISDADIVADIGPRTIENLSKNLVNYQALVWNGPLGAFEIKPFNLATENLAKAVAQKTAEKKLLSVAGGGDVVSALNGCSLADKFTYISTAGGAFLEWLEGKKLPGIKELEMSYKSAPKNAATDDHEDDILGQEFVI